MRLPRSSARLWYGASCHTSRYVCMYRSGAKSRMSWPLPCRSAAVRTGKSPASTCRRNTAFSAPAGSSTLMSSLTSYFFSRSRRRTIWVTRPTVAVELAKLSAAGWAATRRGRTRVAAAAPATSSRRRRLLGRLHPVEAERLEERHVLEREQDRRLGAGVRVLVHGARRDREEIALAPVVGDAVDDRAPAPAHHVVDGARRLAVGTRANAGAQHLQIAPQRGDDRPARVRIAILHENVVERVGFGAGPTGELRVRVRPAVVHVTRGRALAHRLLLAGVGIHVEVLEVAHDGRVEPIGPDHRLGPLVAVVVPGHGRRDHQVAPPHHALVALDRGERALAVQH